MVQKVLWSRATEDVTAMNAESTHEAHSFVCLDCGYGWEQDFEIRHTTDRSGHRGSQYFVKGRPVPSPLRQAVCPACTGRKIRILRPGRVASAQPHD